MEKVLKQIQKKVEALNIKMGECLSEETIVALEYCHKIAYRLFLKHIGNGCVHMFEGYHLNDLENIPCQELSKPFMLEKFWLWEDDERDSDIIEAEMQNKVYWTRRISFDLFKKFMCPML